MPGLREFTCVVEDFGLHAVLEMQSDAEPVTFPRSPKRHTHVFVLVDGLYVCKSHPAQDGPRGALHPAT